jgi:hypothetical protein
LGPSLALPHELKFLPKGLTALRPPDPLGESLEPDPATWEDVQAQYGCYVVLDEYARSGVSVLSTREPVFWWEVELENFPSGELLPAREVSAGALNTHLSGVSPYAYLGEDGTLQRAWRCPSLLQAMYFMLYLDLTGGRSVRKCGSAGCGKYYLAGLHSRSKYCSARCANRASTRLGRGQEP